jgi:hypothetical protein
MRHCGHDPAGLDVTEVISRSFESPGARVSLQDVNRIMRLTVPLAPMGPGYTSLDSTAAPSERADIPLHPPAQALAACAYSGGLRAQSNTFL